MISHTYKNMPPKELETFGALVTTRLENNPILSTIKAAGLADLLPALKALSDAILDYDNLGGSDRKNLRETCRTTLIAQLYLTSIKVEGLAQGNSEIIVASGYVLRKTTRSTVNKKVPPPIEAPSFLKVTDIEGKPGTVHLMWGISKGVRTYGIEKRPRGIDAPWVNGNLTTNNYIELSGFDSDSVMEFRVCAYGLGETKSEFTPAVGLLVT